MKKKVVLWICGLVMTAVVAGCGQVPEEQAAGGQTAVSAEVQTEVQESGSQTEVQDATEEKDAGNEADSQTGEQNAESQQNQEPEYVCPLEDGVYLAEFDTDSSMFHVNEAKDGKGNLTVADGKMTIHVSLVSKNIVNLYLGSAEKAQTDEAAWLQHTTDTVTYSDGLSDEVFGFDVPVPYLDEEFDLAILGAKGKWYDHKVSVSNAQKQEAEAQVLEDGEYQAEVVLGGGSGKATVESPAKITVADGKASATITWSSKNYDYMIVDGEKYLNEAAEGEKSQFTIPVAAFGVELPVTGDTVAMGNPHEIEYTLFFELAE